MTVLPREAPKKTFVPLKDLLSTNIVVCEKPILGKTEIAS